MIKENIVHPKNMSLNIHQNKNLIIHQNKSLISHQNHKNLNIHQNLVEEEVIEVLE